MKTYKLSHLVILVFVLTANLLSASVPKPQVALKSVFINQVNSRSKEIIKLYDDKSYEFLFFDFYNKKARVKREKGTYRLKHEHLILKNLGKSQPKKHADRYVMKESTQLLPCSKLGRIIKSKKSSFTVDNDKKYWEPTYHDSVFGEISNDRKSSKKIIEPRPDYTPKLNPISEQPKADPNNLENITRLNDRSLVSFDSLRKLKAIIIVGPVEESTKEFIDEQKATAKYLRSVGVQVYEFYHPNAKWDDIVKASEDANILIYSGHGRVSVFCITDKTVEGEEIQRDLKLHKNAIVIFNHACESAGSSAIDRKDIGQAEAFRRVGDYAKTFVGSNASVYYANNYNDCLIPFFSAFFSRKTIKSIYNKEATKWTKIETTKKYAYDPKLEISVASKNDTEATHTVKTYQNGKLKKVEELKGHKTYDIAFVGKPNYTVLDLFK